MENEPLDPLKEAQKRYEASYKGKVRNWEYKERNKEKLKKYRREWYMQKMASNPEFAEKERERIRKASNRHYQRNGKKKTEILPDEGMNP